MLSFKFFGFSPSGHAKTPKPTPHNDRRTKGKLRKVKYPNTTFDIVDQSTPMEREGSVNIPTVLPEGEDSREYNQKQPAGTLLNDLETGDPPNINNADAAYTFSPHTQADNTNHLSSSISEDPSRDFSESSEKPKVQTPASVAPTRLWSSIPSARRDSVGGGAGNSSTHKLDVNHGAVQYWADAINSAPDDIPKRRRLITADPHQHGAQEHHDAENRKKQQNDQIYQPIVSQASSPEEDKNRARRENVSKQDHRETSKAAVLGNGDRVENSFEPEIYYYVVPAGLDIIFQDEDGSEITRVGKTINGTQDHSSHVRTKNVPIVVQDVLGNELFRSGTFKAINQPSPLPQQVINPSRDLGMVDAMAGDDFVGRSPNHTSWRTILVDEKGKQIPLKYPERNVGRSTPPFPA